MRTTFPEEIEKSGAPDTALTQETPESGPNPEKDVKFPKRIKFRGRELATIYRPSKSYPNYRVAWTAGGRRMMKGFHRYGEAKSHADQLVKDLAKGSRVTRLTPGARSPCWAPCRSSPRPPPSWRGAPWPRPWTASSARLPW